MVIHDVKLIRTAYKHVQLSLPVHINPASGVYLSLIFQGVINLFINNKG